MRATTYRDNSHVRIYATWLDLPTWRALSLAAQALLVRVMAEYRPGRNGFLEWPARKAAASIGVSKATASRALTELERNGWLQVVRVAAFSGAHRPALYRLTMYPCDATGEPASRAFEQLSGERATTDRKIGAKARPIGRRACPSGETVRFGGRDTTVSREGHRERKTCATGEPD